MLMFMKWIHEIAWQFFLFVCGLVSFACFIIGAAWLGSRVSEAYFGPYSKPRAEYQNIILDDATVVRCRVISRGHGACTLLSDCDDFVDRCVATFEILRREPRSGEVLPTEKGD